MYTIETLATWDNLPTICELEDAVERDLPLTHEQLFVMHLVVEEIATNVIKYSYAGEPGPIALRISYADRTLRLEMRDKGQPFDPREAALPDLLADADKREAGGLGVFLVLDMVDTITYERDGAWNVLTVTKRATPPTLFDVLRGVSLFGGFDDAALNAVVEHAVEQRLAMGQVLFREGDAGHACFVLLRGRLEVLKRLGSDEIVLDTVHPGSIIGEMALIDQSPRSATIRAGSDCRLLVLTEDAFYDLMHNNPVAALDLLRGGTQRLRATNQRMVDRVERKNAELRRAYDELQSAQADQLRLEGIQQELTVARRIQEVFWPHVIPQPLGWQVAARNRGANEVGGDFYDVIPLAAQSAERRAQSADGDMALVASGASARGSSLVGLVIADVCGKGVPAALFMALTRSLLRAASQWAPPVQAAAIVEHALALTNEYIAVEHAPSNMFITLFYGVLDPATGALAYVNAGHNPPLLVRAAGAVEPLRATVLPIGIMQVQQYVAQRVQLEPGDLLLCFTDGVTEALDAVKGEFGDERLLATLREAAPRGAHATIAAVERAVDAFAAGEPQADDITLLAVSWTRDEG